MPRRRQPGARSRSLRLGKTVGKFPAAETVDEHLPEWRHDTRHVQHQSPRSFRDSPAGLEHVALKAAEIETTAGRRFVLDPQHGRQVEGQQRQPQQSFIGLKIIVRKTWPDGLLKLADAILERASLTVMIERRRTVQFLRFPTNHEKEIVGQQVELPRFRIGPIDDHQQHALGVFPGLGSIQAEFDDFLIAALWRTTDGPLQIRRGQPIEHCVGS